MDLVGNTQLIIGQSAGNFSKKKHKMKQDKKIICLPGEVLSDKVKDSLKQVNVIKTQKNKNFKWYKTEIAKIFGIQFIPKTVVKHKIFFGGFVAGEGSINVSAKKSENALFGIVIDPEFSISQHVNGFEYLFLALSLFETGSIRFKSGSNATLVYRIDNRKSLKQKIIPFWETYILPYQQGESIQRLILFKRILFFLEEKKHKDLSFFINIILPLWDKLRKQKDRVNESFHNLQEAQLFAVTEQKRKGSSETLRDLI